MTAVIAHGADLTNLTEVMTGRMLFATLQSIFVETIFTEIYNFIWPLYVSTFYFFLFTLFPLLVSAFNILFGIVTFDPSSILISIGDIIDDLLFKTLYGGWYGR